MDLVRLMGGTISAESEEGKGTILRFSVTYKDALKSSSGEVPGSAVPAEQFLTKKKILIVDDDLTGRETLMFILSDQYEIASADCGAAALELF